MADKPLSLFSRLKAGQKIVVCLPDGEPFEVSWGPREGNSQLTKCSGDAVTKVPMTEAECYAWLAAEQARGLTEGVLKKSKISAPTPAKKVAKKASKK